MVLHGQGQGLFLGFWQRLKRWGGTEKISGGEANDLDKVGLGIFQGHLTGGVTG